MTELPTFPASTMAVPLSIDTPPKPIAVRNVKNVVLGDTLFKTWYPSFYPEELVGREVDRLFVCQWCFKYSKDRILFLAHAVCLTPDTRLDTSDTDPYEETVPG